MSSPPLSSKAVFKYEPLEHFDSIRLLLLEPAEDVTAELRASFRSVRLGDAASYEAISYVWGPAAFSDSIAICQKSLDVTESLASALKAMRFPIKERILWADAVCIDQNDLIEKQRQVAMMGDIYKTASRVLIWLGCGNDKTDRAIRGYQVTAETPEIRSLIQQLTHSTHIAADFTYFLNDEWTAFMDPGDVEEHPLQMLCDYDMNILYDQPWFTRLWIVQEICLASEAVIFCGAAQLDWVCFAVVMVYLRSNIRVEQFSMAMRNPKALHQACSIIEAWAAYRVVTSLPAQPRYRAVLQRFSVMADYLRGQQCTDDRDRIYGLLSLQHLHTSIAIYPDYTASVFDIYKEYATKTLMNGILEPLYSAGVWYRSEYVSMSYVEISLHQYLPTWTPDFRKSSYRKQLPWLNYSGYSCGISRAPKISVQKIRGAFSPIIQIGGFVFDEIVDTRVEDLHRTTIFMAGVSPPYEKTRQLIKDCRAMLASDAHSVRDKYPNQEDLDFAFWSTVVMDGVPKGYHDYMPKKQLAILPKGIQHFGSMYEKHCLPDNGEVTKVGLVDLLDNDEIMELSEEAQHAAFFYPYIRETMNGISFIVGKHGYMGLAPPGVKPGDLIAIIHGAPYPFVLRPWIGAEFYALVGTCYIHGIMNGAQCMDEDSTVQLL